MTAEDVAMLKHVIWPFTLSLFASVSGCGSSDEDEPTAPAGSAGGGTTGTTINVGSGGTAGMDGTVSIDPMQDGGIVVLSEEQVGTINEAACAGWSAEPEGGEPAVLQFVVDTSLSMSLAPGDTGGFGMQGGGGPTKWEITRDALLDAIAELPDSLPVGLFFYPNRNNDFSSEPLPLEACVNTNEGIAVDALTAAHRDELEQALDDTEPAGWTPTHGAYKHALDTFLLPADFPGSKFMLLITDGAPTLTLECVGAGSGQQQGLPIPVDAQPIVEEVAAAREAGVRTFLIGSPGSEDGRQWMSEAAIQGATAAPGCQAVGEPYCHMDMTTATDFSAALRAGLSQIAHAILSCSYSYPQPPPGETIDPTRVNLIVTTSSGETQLVMPDQTGECTEGWQIVGDQIVLCDGTCSRVQNDPGASLQLLFGCATGVVPK